MTQIAATNSPPHRRSVAGAAWTTAHNRPARGLAFFPRVTGRPGRSSTSRPGCPISDELKIGR